eukprot:SAG31_NODE_4599_length_3104_cov_4.379368_3_plen_187_part_00
MLVGERATEFAIMAGFEEQSLSTPSSEAMHADWLSALCQPNFYRGFPGDESGCPPYARPPHSKSWGNNQSMLTASARRANDVAAQASVTRMNHDTIGMIAVDGGGNFAAGTSTNGARHKIAGRVGDSPIVGSGAFVDNEIGAAVATGDGDLMMRFAVSARAVTAMAAGVSPGTACQQALNRVGDCA